MFILFVCVNLTRHFPSGNHGRLARWRRWSPYVVGEATLTSLHLGHSSSVPSDALPTSQLILQPFHRFTYIIGTSPTSQLILQPFRRFIYATAHSTTLLPLHIRHRTFYNPFVASPTSQAPRVLHLANRPCIRRWKTVCGWLDCYSKLLSLEVATVLDSC